MANGMKYLIIALTVLVSGCAVNVQHNTDVEVEIRYFEPYVLPHEDGGNTLVMHTGTTREEIAAYCPQFEGYVTHGCARLTPIVVHIQNDGTQVTDYLCHIVAEYPEPGFLQGVWDHEEAHCMGWLHEEDYGDPTYKLAHSVGK